MGKANKQNRSKKDVVTAGAKGEKKSTLVGLGLAIAILAVAGFIIFGGGGPGGSFSPVKAEAGMVTIPANQISASAAQYYTYKGAGSKQINFFVLKSSDGVIRAAFDACDVCYREKKGYRQEGDTMVCNNCGQRFPSVKVNEIKGGCNPAPLVRVMDGQNLVIRSADIEKGAWYF